MGISSPPASVTDRAVPKHPSAAYPDLKEPTFFQARDARLEDPAVRVTIEEALSEIVDRSSHTTREEMMEKYGLKPPKKFSLDHQPALDTNRLEGFREHFALLRQVAESYAQISTQRNSSITRTSWAIADLAKFEGFIKLTQSKIDSLITLMDVKEKVDRGMRMDIKALGWHLSADKGRVAQDTSKLRLITEICEKDYPEYLDATRAALGQIERERREQAFVYNPYASQALAAPVSAEPGLAAARRGSAPLMRAGANGATNGGPPKPKHGSLFGGLFKFGKAKSGVGAGRSQSVSAASTGPMEELDPPRALSDSGPVRYGGEDEDSAPLERARSKSVGALPHMESDHTAPTDEAARRVILPNDEVAPTQGVQPMDEVRTVRSKSVGEILEIRPETEEEEAIAQELKRLDNNATVPDEVRRDGGAGDGELLSGAISRHDQFHGLGRQGTKVQWD